MMFNLVSLLYFSIKEATSGSCRLLAIKTADHVERFFVHVIANGQPDECIVLVPVLHFRLCISRLIPRYSYFFTDEMKSGGSEFIPLFIKIQSES